MTNCNLCGGSGIQRISSQSFRTCLTCLGQGSIRAAIPTTVIPEGLQRVQGMQSNSCTRLPAVALSQRSA